jgi:hypothetical protein
MQIIDLKCKEWNQMSQMKLSWSNMSSTDKKEKLQKKFKKKKRIMLMKYNSDKCRINSILKYN